MKFAIFLLVLISFDFSKKQIALTFDDGPCTGGNDLLDALQTAGVKATFFLIGQNVAGNESQITRAVSEGHEIGCHGNGYGSNPSAAEITQGQQAIATAGGGVCSLFRAPNVDYGSVMDACRDLGLPLIGTDCWSNDWDKEHVTTQNVIDNIKNSVHDGAIPLFHWPNTAPQTVAAVGPIVTWLLSEDYEFLTVTQLAAQKGVTLRAGVRYDSIVKCDTLTAAGTCNAQFHCTWAGGAGGACLDTCKNLACELCDGQPKCVGQAKCEWNGTDCDEKPGCTGTTCSSCPNDYACGVKFECEWSTGGNCINKPGCSGSTCSSCPNDYACGGKTECEWSTTCIDKPCADTTCPSCSYEPSCVGTTGCVWDGSACAAAPQPPASSLRSTPLHLFVMGIAFVIGASLAGLFA